SFASITTKTRAESAGGDPFVSGRAKNGLHVIYIAKPETKVNGYFSVNLCDFDNLSPFCDSR
ncbi:MAG: hypothetical protein OEV36_06625, partial [Myxococcales bacterium]|nr:hypothetical protein [Myxococcales bacterium]